MDERDKHCDALEKLLKEDLPLEGINQYFEDNPETKWTPIQEACKEALERYEKAKP